MVAINGREVIRRAVNVLRSHYNRCLTSLFYGRPTVLGRSSSFVQSNIKKPTPTLVPLPPKKTWTQVAPNGQIPKSRKQGRVKRKRYNDLAKDNSTLLMPGGFRKESPKEKQKARRKGAKNDLQDDHEPIDCDSEHEVFVKRQLDSLMLEKDKRESQFNVKVVSERVKKKAPERKARLKREKEEAERLWKMQELERREEKEGSDRWKDQRLAQLEREKQVAENELAREKAERKQSKLQRVFKEQQQRHKEEERWKRLREKDAKAAAKREGNLLRENAMLQDNLQATDDAFRRACDEREHLKQEKEEERVRRLRVEKSLHQWKELMKEYFPGGQQEHPQQQPPLRQRLPNSLEAQFKLYEKKWEVLRSGVDIDGSEVHLISFSQIPWPVINMTPTDPSQIKPEHIKQFLMHPLRERPDSTGKRRNKRLRARDELMRWHSDKFDQVLLSKVRKEDKKAATEAAGMIARVLTDMLS